jgi:deoxyribonuclease V
MICRALHPWKVSARDAIKIQKQLSKNIISPSHFLRQPTGLFQDDLMRKKRHAFLSGRFHTIAAADVSFPRKSSKAIVALLAFRFPSLKLIEKIIMESEAKFPYIPGLLSFREGPLLIRAFRKMRTDVDLILFDGQGICHPRRMGIATHMGLILDRPTIGCAKSRLCGDFKEPRNSRGSFSFIKDKKTDEVLAAVLRTKECVKPVFVSVGYKIDLKTAIGIILLVSKHRIPEPLRIAHHYSKMGYIDETHDIS